MEFAQLNRDKQDRYPIATLTASPHPGHDDAGRRAAPIEQVGQEINLFLRLALFIAKTPPAWARLGLRPDPSLGRRSMTSPR